MSKISAACFQAVDIEDGTIHEIKVVFEINDATFPGDITEIKYKMASTGHPVTPIGDETFEVIDTGQRLRKIRKGD